MKNNSKTICNRQLNTEVNSYSESNEVKRRTSGTSDPQLWRDILAFWILGLGSQFGCIVIISAAEDIVQGLNDDPDVS